MGCRADEADFLPNDLIQDKDTARPGEFSKLKNAEYPGADMTHETAKALLMMLILGGLQAAIHIPKIWASQRWASLVGTMAHGRSAHETQLPPASILALILR